MIIPKTSFVNDNNSSGAFNNPDSQSTNGNILGNSRFVLALRTARRKGRRGLMQEERPLLFHLTPTFDVERRIYYTTRRRLFEHVSFGSN